MDETTVYQLLHAGEEESAPRTDDGCQLYPGERHGDRVMDVMSYGPPAGSLLLKTGGNALQAVDKDVLDKQNVFSVVVPECVKPGDNILVRCPHSSRLISTTIPPEALPGHIFLVRSPPIKEVVTGVPLESGTHTSNGIDIIAAAAEKELHLREETSRNRSLSFDQDEGTNFEEVSLRNTTRDKHNSDQGFAMVNQRNQSQKGAVAAVVAFKTFCRHIIF